MSVPIATSIQTYQGNGSTVNPYPINFRFLLATDIKVVSVPRLVLNGGLIVPTFLQPEDDYTLTIFTNASNEITGGQIKTTEPWGEFFDIIIYRDVPLTQLTELPEFGPFPANTLEMALDKVVMAQQQQARAIERCFRVSEFAPQLSAAYPQKNTLLGIGGDGQMRAFDGEDLGVFLELPSTVSNRVTALWFNSGDRVTKVPDFTGQLGLQMDNRALYVSTSTSVGAWSPYALTDVNLAPDRTYPPPTQSAVKAYADARLMEANEYTDAAVAAVTSVFPTGVTVPHALSTAPAGWVFASGGTIGNAASNGEERANADCEALFLGLWDSMPSLAIYPHDTESPVSRGASAAADWAANRRLALPDLRGRVVAGRDAMGVMDPAQRITNSSAGHPNIEGYTLGATGGVDRHTLLTAQMPVHNHGIAYQANLSTGGPGANMLGTGATDTTNNAGSGEAHPNVQPTIMLNYIIKL